MDSLIERLTDAAGRATPGEWSWREDDIGGVCPMRVLAPGILVLDNGPGSGGPWGDEIDQANAAYIALANPANILALIEALQASAQREKVLREALGEMIMTYIDGDNHGEHGGDADDADCPTCQIIRSAQATYSMGIK